MEVIDEQVVDMDTTRLRFAIAAIGAACGLASAALDARAMDVAPPNPPRTQQQILKERMAACRDLRGPALRDCMANYVGTPEKSQTLRQEGGARDDQATRAPDARRPSADQAQK